MTVALAEIRDTPLSVDEVMAAVSDPTAGGICLFVGVVRNHDHSEDVAHLDYSAHPQAFEVCRELIDEFKATVPIWKHQRFADGADEWVGLP